MSVNARSGKRPGTPAAEYAVDPRVDAYLEMLPDWQRDVCQRIRDLVHAADSELIETIKRTKLPFFVLQGNVCALMAARDHVNVFLYDGGTVPDPAGIITAGHDNQTARTIGIREGESINARAVTVLIKQIIANNRAGGWRTLKRIRNRPADNRLVTVRCQARAAERIGNGLRRRVDLDRRQSGRSTHRDQGE